MKKFEKKKLIILILININLGEIKQNQQIKKPKNNIDISQKTQN